MGLSANSLRLGEAVLFDPLVECAIIWSMRLISKTARRTLIITWENSSICSQPQERVLRYEISHLSSESLDVPFDYDLQSFRNLTFQLPKVIDFETFLTFSTCFECQKRLERRKLDEHVLQIKWSKILQLAYLGIEALTRAPSLSHVKVDIGMKKSAFFNLYFCKGFPKSIFSSHLNVPPRLRRYAPYVRIRRFLDEVCRRQQPKLRGDPTFLLSR